MRQSPINHIGDSASISILWATDHGMIRKFAVEMP